MSSGTEPVSWGKDAVVQGASAPGLACEVLETEPAREQARSTFLTHAPADICVKGGDSSFRRSLRTNFAISFLFYK